MHKHYIRLDNENYIIKGFSDICQETILETDVLLRETDQRHFYIGDYIFNPSLTEDGQPTYKYIDNEIVKVSPKAKTLTIEDINNQVISKIRESYDINEESKCLRLGISDNQNAEYLAYKAHVESCVLWGRNEKELLGLI